MSIVLDYKEAWIYINGCKTKYKIASPGYVFIAETGKKMAGGLDKNGYRIVSLTFNGKKYTRKVHRLVAEAFIPNPNNYPEVNHEDGNKDNPDIHNLTWSTSAENTHHAYRTHLRKGNLKDEKIVREICEMLQNEVRVGKISKKMQVNQSYISKIKNGTIWKSVSKEYYFPRDNDTRALIGEENPMAKVSVKEVKKICKLLEKGKTAKEISKKLGISMTIIYSIKQRKTWVSISKEYKF